VAVVNASALERRRVMVRERSLAEMPSYHRPFIFFHQRKAGGSSVRKTLHAAAAELKLPFAIPCYGGLNCNTYDPPLAGKAVVYGGHYYWPSFLKMLGQREWTAPTEFPSKLSFDCLTIFREPASRVRSCWNFRMTKSPGFDTLSAADLKERLPHAMSKFAEGCNNEALRILSDSGAAEEVVNELTAATTGLLSSNDDDLDDLDDYSHLVGPGGENRSWAIGAVGVLARTLEHQQRCVVGLLERCEATELAVRFFFPWYHTFSCDVHANTGYRSGGGPFRVDDMPRDVVEEILRENALDSFAYQAASAMLDAQLAAICEFVSSQVVGGKRRDHQRQNPTSNTTSGVGNKEKKTDFDFSKACTLLQEQPHRQPRR